METSHPVFVYRGLQSHHSGKATPPARKNNTGPDDIGKKEKKRLPSIFKALQREAKGKENKHGKASRGTMGTIIVEVDGKMEKLSVPIPPNSFCPPVKKTHRPLTPKPAPHNVLRQPRPSALRTCCLKHEQPKKVVPAASRSAAPKDALCTPVRRIPRSNGTYFPKPSTLVKTPQKAPSGAAKSPSRIPVLVRATPKRIARAPETPSLDKDETLPTTPSTPGTLVEDAFEIEKADVKPTPTKITCSVSIQTCTVELAPVQVDVVEIASPVPESGDLSLDAFMEGLKASIEELKQAVEANDAPDEFDDVSFVAHDNEALSQENPWIVSSDTSGYGLLSEAELADKQEQVVVNTPETDTAVWKDVAVNEDEIMYREDPLLFLMIPMLDFSPAVVPPALWRPAVHVPQPVEASEPKMAEPHSTTEEPVHTSRKDVSEAPATKESDMKKEENVADKQEKRITRRALGNLTNHAKPEEKKSDDQELPTEDKHTQSAKALNGIQARIAAMQKASGAPMLSAAPAHMRRLKSPEWLEGTTASKDKKIQREVAALRAMKRVGGGGDFITKTRAVSDGGPSRVADENDEPKRSLSLATIGLLAQRKQRNEGKA